jgi:hypothetical protein
MLRVFWPLLFPCPGRKLPWVLEGESVPRVQDQAAKNELRRSVTQQPVRGMTLLCCGTPRPPTCKTTNQPEIVG